jgi:outer membrane usher protein FimD/PapC
LQVAVSPRRAEAEFDPQDGDIRLLPTYRSGTLVRLGRPATIAATVTLKWSDGKPAALQNGTLTDAGGGATEFISNRQGEVYVAGLAAGDYSATLSGYPDARFTLTIPASRDREVRLEDIQLPVKP